MAEEELSNPLDSPEFLDWLQVEEKAVGIISNWFQGTLGVGPEKAEQGARSLLARLAREEITVEWNR